MLLKKIKSLPVGLTIVIAAMLPSCKLPEALVYQPRVTLEKSSFVIDKKVLVKDFIDSRPASDTSTTQIDFRSVVHRPNFQGNLSYEIESAIISDFSKNQVFRKIGKDVVSPDYVLTGEVKKFKGQARPTTYGAISFYSVLGIYTWFFGMPVVKQETESVIDIKIYTANGELIGTYEGKSSQIRRKSTYGLKKFSKGLPARTNETFSNSVNQIRNQILSDLVKYNK